MSGDHVGAHDEVMSSILVSDVKTPIKGRQTETSKQWRGARMGEGDQMGTLFAIETTGHTPGLISIYGQSSQELRFKQEDE
jgi:glyoxylase-like metal-dependent hydrolase (beta-lactamase superfamily II)